MPQTPSLIRHFPFIPHTHKDTGAPHSSQGQARVAVYDRRKLLGELSKAFPGGASGNHASLPEKAVEAKPSLSHRRLARTCHYDIII